MSSENYVEIGYSERFICPTPESVALLRTEEGRQISGQGIESFTILQVPRRVSEILFGLKSEEFRGTTPWELVQKALSEVRSSGEKTGAYFILRENLHRSGIEYLPDPKDGFAHLTLSQRVEMGEVLAKQSIPADTILTILSRLPKKKAA